MAIQIHKLVGKIDRRQRGIVIKRALSDIDEITTRRNFHFRKSRAYLERKVSDLLYAFTDFKLGNVGCERTIYRRICILRLYGAYFD